MGDPLISKLEDETLASLDLWRLLARNSQERANHEAIIFNGRRLSYAEIFSRSEALAAGLFKFGLRKGDKLALIMPNWPEFVITYFAAARLGWCLIL